MYANLCVYSGDTKMLLSAQAQRLINIYLSNLPVVTLSASHTGLHTTYKFLLFPTRFFNSFLVIYVPTCGTLFLCVHATYHINVYFYTTTNTQLFKARTTYKHERWNARISVQTESQIATVHLFESLNVAKNRFKHFPILRFCWVMHFYNSLSLW